MWSRLSSYPMALATAAGVLLVTLLLLPLFGGRLVAVLCAGAAAAAGALYLELRSASEKVEELTSELARRQRGASRQDMQTAITGILAEAESLQAAAPPLLQAIGSSLDWQLAALWETDPASGLLRCLRTWSRDAKPGAFETEIRSLTLQPGVDLPGRVWSEGVAIWMPELARERNAPRAASAARDGLHGACAFPIVRRAKTVGVVELFSRDVREADAETLQSLTDIGHQIGQFTERKRAEQRLRLLSEASAVLGASLDTATTLASVARLVVPALADSCVIDIVEEDGSIRRLTPAGLESLPAGEAPAGTPIDVRGSHPLQRVLASGRPEILPDLTDKLLKAMVADAVQLASVRRGGPRSGLCVPLATRGRVLGAISLAALDSEHRYGPDDLTLAEELARRCAVAVDNARLFRDAQRASEEKTRFLAAVSHDLRTPAHAIMLLSTLIRRDAESRADASGDFAARCRRIEQASSAFTQLLGNLLDFASLESGQKRMQEAPFAVQELLDETTANLGSVARAKGLALECRRLAAGLTVRGDRTELGRVLINLIGNALKFTRHGSVTVSARSTDAGVEIAVADTGPGIPEEELPFVFDEFFQVRNPDRDRAKGSGLGLAISKRIMEAMGGSLGVLSSPGEGAVFTAVIPADRVLAEAASPPPEPEPQGERRADGASILVIDDDAVAAEALAEILRQEGYRTTVAGGGEEGLRTLKESPADLVLVDMMMPGLDGVEVTTRIRAGRSRETRVIVLTGDVTRERMQAAEEAGADGFVSKPFQVETFLETVRLALAGAVPRTG